MSIFTVANEQLIEADHQNRLCTKIRYLYILSVIEILRKAEPTYLDEFITMQYIEQSHLFPINDANLGLVKQFQKNHPEVLHEFILDKYLGLINEVLTYMKHNFFDFNKFTLVPLTPAVRVSVMQFIQEKGNDIVNSLHKDYSKGLCWIDRSVETMASMLEGNFSMAQSLAAENNKDYGLTMKERTFNQRDMGINPELFKQFLDNLEKKVYSLSTYNTSSLASKTSVYHLKFIANVLSIYAHLLMPMDMQPKDVVSLYRDLVAYEIPNEKLDSIYSRYRDLIKLNSNNALSISTDNTYINICKDTKTGYQLEEPVERFIVLSCLLNWEI